MHQNQTANASPIVDRSQSAEIADARAQLEGAERAASRALADLGRVIQSPGFKEDPSAPDVVGAAEMVRSGMAQISQARALID